MESKKVGSFITALRKEKGLTQKQLAQRLNVTDKAVSRWETGKGYPDIEILINLAQELGVTVNELLSGKRLEKDTMESACEENVVSAYEKVKKLRNKNLFFVIFSILLVIALCVTAIVSVKDENIRQIDFTLNTAKKAAVFDEIAACLSRNGLDCIDSVCTDMTLIFDKEGNLEYTDIILNDQRGHRREINIKTFIDERGYTKGYILVRYDFISEEDGVSLEKLWEYIYALDAKEIIEKYAFDKSQQSIIVNIDSSIYLTLPENRTVEFGGKQQLLKDRKIIPVHSSEGMKGKYFESVITAAKEAMSCCSVYIER